MVEIKPFDPVHVADLLPRLCKTHRARAEAMAPLDRILEVALPASVLLRTGLVDGQPECIMGMVVGAEAGHPWLLKTERAERHFRTLVRYCRPFIAECHEVRPLLIADVEPEDGMLRRWLTWLGFRRAGMVERWDRWERFHGA